VTHTVADVRAWLLAASSRTRQTAPQQHRRAELRDARPWRTIALLIVLLTLSTRLVVPQGSMLSPTDDGVIRISLCTGQGTVEMGLSPNDELMDLPEHDSCRWAFEDTSRNRSKRWCASSACGTPTKVRAFRQRRRASHNA